MEITKSSSSFRSILMFFLLNSNVITSLYGFSFTLVNGSEQSLYQCSLSSVNNIVLFALMIKNFAQHSFAASGGYALNPIAVFSIKAQWWLTVKCFKIATFTYRQPLGVITTDLLQIDIHHKAISKSVQQHHSQ